MAKQPSIATRPNHSALLRTAGVLVALLSMVGLILGILLTRSLGDDIRSTVSVSRSALIAIDQTVETVDAIAVETAASLEAASGSVDSASTTVERTVDAIDELTRFLDEELPATIESIQTSMPAAIQTANAIDGTLRALSLLGVDYDPDQAFGDALADVNTALDELPDQLSAQSESLQRLTPSAEELAGQTDTLSASMDELTRTLTDFTLMTEGYATTIDEAEAAIENTDNSVERSMWLILGLVIGVGVAGLTVGVSLVMVGRSIEALHLRALALEVAEEEPVDV